MTVGEFGQYMLQWPGLALEIKEKCHLTMLGVMHELAWKLNDLCGIHSETVLRCEDDVRQSNEYDDMRDNVLFIEEKESLRNKVDCQNGVRLKIDLLFFSLLTSPALAIQHHSDFDSLFKIVDHLIDKCLLATTTTSNDNDDDNDDDDDEDDDDDDLSVGHVRFNDDGIESSISLNGTAGTISLHRESVVRHFIWKLLRIDSLDSRTLISLEYSVRFLVMFLVTRTSRHFDPNGGYFSPILVCAMAMNRLKWIDTLFTRWPTLYSMIERVTATESDSSCQRPLHSGCITYCGCCSRIGRDTLFGYLDTNKLMKTLSSTTSETNTSTAALATLTMAEADVICKRMRLDVCVIGCFRNDAALVSKQQLMLDFKEANLRQIRELASESTEFNDIDVYHRARFALRKTPASLFDKSARMLLSTVGPQPSVISLIEQIRIKYPHVLEGYVDRLTFSLGEHCLRIREETDIPRLVTNLFASNYYDRLRRHNKEFL